MNRDVIVFVLGGAAVGCGDFVGRQQDAGSTDAPHGAARVVQIAAGGQHTCARMGDGTARCWGLNQSGELGDGTTVNRLRPTIVAGVRDVTAIAAGGGQVEDQTTRTVRLIGCTCARLMDGTARCWGENTFGQLGDGTQQSRATAAPVADLTGVVQLAVGGLHVCALLADTSVRCWGLNDGGQLGDGTRRDRNIPVPVVGLTNVLEVAVGGQHSCARMMDGTVQCWGRNDLGQLGEGTTTPIRTAPTPVLGIVQAAHLALGNFHTCILLADGTVRCAGMNQGGELGTGGIDPEPTPHPRPTLLAGLSSLVGLTVGNSHGCVVLSDSTVRCWGRGTYGQLGDGMVTSRGLPTLGPNLMAVDSLALGNGHSCARLRDGSVHCWGLNDAGQLGDGTTAQRSTPVLVVGL